ncbi:tetratricopeptide repeat protein [Cryptosporangium aurantiacum]|uniref:Tetratricopeptide repeat-containing protein n=1 Tax=Cryptosporangium aurantiacum TaxID=134849 RepID=A0A1M7KTF3_9ACTN|nr:tetratricopeptide repeat protein [Cryptosporangium aurantiacum]SHM68832.1 Tetratricopeptide repeat-containing protein [Cryptosporangium aurantiacum]
MTRTAQPAPDTAARPAADDAVPPDATADDAVPPDATADDAVPPEEAADDAVPPGSAADEAAAPEAVGHGSRRLRAVIVVAVLAVGLLAVGGVVGLRDSSTPASAPAPQTQPESTAALDTAIADAQQRLRRLPRDYATWASLGSAYLEKARITADPSWYPRAEGALRRSLDVRPAPNPAALTGLGALANARHDFPAGRDFAQRALAQNPYSADAQGVLADAETQLGHADAATAAVQRMLDLRPALPALTRASYDLEQHGRVDEATALMRRALATAVDPADIAFCRYQLGELAWNSGDLDTAAQHYDVGHRADPDYLPLYQGRAKVAAARGDLPAALADYRTLTQRSPTPTYLLEYAELLRAADRPTEAATQLALADAAGQLFAANGGSDDLTTVTLALARGKPAEALAAAEREWKRRQFSDVADAMAQALHANGRHAEALRYAEKASALGVRNAHFLYHQGVIEAALGRPDAARRSLSAALALNPHFSPVEAPAARRTLASL